MQKQVGLLVLKLRFKHPPTKEKKHKSKVRHRQAVPAASSMPCKGQRWMIGKGMLQENIQAVKPL